MNREARFISDGAELKTGCDYLQPGPCSDMIMYAMIGRSHSFAFDSVVFLDLYERLFQWMVKLHLAPSNELLDLKTAPAVHGIIRECSALPHLVRTTRQLNADMGAVLRVIVLQDDAVASMPLSTVSVLHSRILVLDGYRILCGTRLLDAEAAHPLASMRAIKGTAEPVVQITCIKSIASTERLSTGCLLNHLGAQGILRVGPSVDSGPLRPGLVEAAMGPPPPGARVPRLGPRLQGFTFTTFFVSFRERRRRQAILFQVAIVLRQSVSEPSHGARCSARGVGATNRNREERVRCRALEGTLKIVRCSRYI
jgi:hypothetical protein